MRTKEPCHENASFIHRAYTAVVSLFDDIDDIVSHERMTHATKNLDNALNNLFETTKEIEIIKHVEEKQHKRDNDC